MLFRLDPLPPSLVTQDHLRLDWIACPRELALDAERGIALSDTAFLDGKPFHRVAFTEIAFDLTIPAERFVFDAPAGEEVRDVGEVYGSREQEPIHVIAASAGFTVLAATRLSPEWTVMGRRTEAHERSGTPENVHLYYGSGNGSIQLNVNQTAAGAAAEALPAPDGTGWRSERRDGTDYGVWEPSGDDCPMARQLLFEREGTRVQIMSSTLGAEALISFATTFAPAPTEWSPPTV